MVNANDPTLQSWIDVPSTCDFPIQNLPFGIFKTTDLSPRVGVAIGDYVLDLFYLHENGFIDDLKLPADIFNQPFLNEFIGLGKQVTGNVRNRIAQLLSDQHTRLKDNTAARERALVAMADVEMLMPVNVPNYTDFYSSIDHATNVGKMFRDPANALLPNWKHLPVGYHGRASSIIPSGIDVYRPKGQTKAPDADMPSFGPSKRVDFELEVAFITCKENGMGNSITTQEADDYIFGFVLFNDWSARDMQVWEYVPLGPFLAKNFASSVSPWVVTMDALEPFRVPGEVQHPPVLPYLQYNGAKNFDVNLEVYLQPEGSAENLLSRSNFKYMYWNVNQQLAHHTVNGCNMQVGDMYASGTISGPSEDAYGSMLELSWKGTKPIRLDDGSERKFVEDGDTIVMRGYAEKDNVRIGFGEVRSKLLPAK